MKDKLSKIINKLKYFKTRILKPLQKLTQFIKNNKNGISLIIKIILTCTISIYMYLIYKPLYNLINNYLILQMYSESFLQIYYIYFWIELLNITKIMHDFLLNYFFCPEAIRDLIDFLNNSFICLLNKSIYTKFFINFHIFLFYFILIFLIWKKYIFLIWKKILFRIILF